MEERFNDPSASVNNVANAEVLAFDNFRLFPGRKLLLEADKPVVLGARAFEILNVLAQRAGQVISKDELIAEVWPGVFVEEGNLRVHIAALRKALSDGAGGRRFILNTPGRGYSFGAVVSRFDKHPGPGKDVFQAPAADNLPAILTRIVGRDDIVEALISQMLESRFTTIVGPGGIGKTTVALAVASALRSSYRDGVWLVDLAPTADPALVPSVLASVLGLRVSSDRPIPELVSILKERRALLLLDNCEHVVDVAATLAEQLFIGAPRIHILATSREALRVRGERVQRLPPLEIPPAKAGLTAKEALSFPAVQLFVDRAVSTMDMFDLSESDAPVVAEICRRLDGNALAINLAAGKVQAFGAQGVATRLGDRFRLLTHGFRTALPHHQTLAAAYDWSYEFLTEPARRVFRRLAVYAGSFVLESASVIVATDDVHNSDVADQVASLVSTSLVVANLSGNTVSYRLLESTRAYARERLIQAGEFEQIASQHALYFLDILKPAEGDAATLPAIKWFEIYGPQLDDLRVALDWALSAQGNVMLGIDLTIAAVPLLLRSSLNEECRSRAEIALARLGSGGFEDRRAMRLYAGLGSALSYTRRTGPDSSKAWAKALEIAEEIHDNDYQLRALRGLWTDRFSAGEVGYAKEFAEKFGRIALTSEAAALISNFMKGMLSLYKGDWNTSARYIGQSLQGHIKATAGANVIRYQLDQRELASTALASVLWFQGLPEQAVRMMEASIEYARAADHEFSIAHSLAYSACSVSIQTGNLEEAERYLSMLSQYASKDPLADWDLFGRCWKGILLNRQGHFGAAASLLESAIAEIPIGSFRLQHSRFLGEFASALGHAGEVSKALTKIDEAIAICDLREERWFFPELLRMRGEIVLINGGPEATSVAEDQFQQSITLARRQGALSFELRTATSVARLMSFQKRNSEAHKLLTSVYERFTEGFETDDLKVAKRFIDNLSSDS